MIQSLDVRRHPDGSIDFDFYRRRATRRRRLVRRFVFRHYLSAIGQAGRTTISAIEKMVDRWQAHAGPSPIRQASAAEVVHPR